MMCESCNERPAAMHITSIVNGEKKEAHLCLQCANEQNIGFSEGFDIGQLLSGFMHEGEQAHRAPVCAQCGMSLTQFRKGGLLGCMECYKTFQAQLEPLLNRVHGHVRHVGKIPARIGGTMTLKREIERLSAEIRKAVMLEQFERAAELRDQIRALEKQREAQKNA